MYYDPARISFAELSEVVRIVGGEHDERSRVAQQKAVDWREVARERELGMRGLVRPARVDAQ